MFWIQSKKANISNKNALQGANVCTSCTSLGQNSSDNSSNKQTQSTHRNTRLEPAIRDAQKLAQNVFPHRNSTVTRSKKQENEKPEMFFSVRRHYTTTFRYVAVILVFFQRGLTIWFLDNLYFLFFIFVFLFLLKTGRKIMMTMFWSGEKARKKITVYDLGTFYLRVWAEPSHRFDEKQSNGNFFNKFVHAKFLRKKKWMK